jgi:hypothetical protein
MNVEYGKDYTNAAELVQRVKAAEGLEGYVLAFENGEMYKMKCNWYMERSKKMAGSFTGQEKELWNIILENKIDDLSEALGERYAHHCHDCVQIITTRMLTYLS